MDHVTCDADPDPVLSGYFGSPGSGSLIHKIHKLYNTKCLLFAVYGPSDRMLVPRTYQRTTDDAQFVLSLGTKVNNNKGRVSIVFTSLSFLHSLGEGITDSKVAPVF